MMWRLLQIAFIVCSVFLASHGLEATAVSAVTSVLLAVYVSRRRHQKNTRSLLPEFRLSSATYLVIASLIMHDEYEVTPMEMLTHDFLLMVWGWLSALPFLLERSDCLAPNYPPFSSSDPVWLPVAAILLQLVLAASVSLTLLTSACTPTMQWDWLLLPADCTRVFQNKRPSIEYVTSALCLLHAALMLVCCLCSRMTSPTVMTQRILKKLKEEQEAMGRYFKGDNSKPRRLLLALTLMLPPAYYCAYHLPIGCRNVIRRVVSPWEMPRLNPLSRDSYCEPLFDVKEVPLYQVETWREAENITGVQGGGSWLGGGAWEPGNCRPWQRVAIIVPYRARERQLVQLLATLHPFLQRQLASYRVFVVEQSGEGVFNRGKVKDAGFLEAERRGPFHCYIFHDVDMLPERQDNLYLCGNQPRHLCPALDEMRYTLLFNALLGGVVAMTGTQFRQANGFPTLYWGWGGEDDDLSARVQELGMTITQPPNHIGRYRMLRHVKDSHNPLSIPLFRTWKNRWKEDGISNPDLMRYSLVSEKEHRLYTHLVVDVGNPPPHMETWSLGSPVTPLWWRQFYKC